MKVIGRTFPSSMGASIAAITNHQRRPRIANWTSIRISPAAMAAAGSRPSTAATAAMSKFCSNNAKRPIETANLSSPTSHCFRELALLNCI